LLLVLLLLSPLYQLWLKAKGQTAVLLHSWITTMSASHHQLPVAKQPHRHVIWTSKSEHRPEFKHAGIILCSSDSCCSLASSSCFGSDTSESNETALQSDGAGEPHNTSYQELASPDLAEIPVQGKCTRCIFMVKGLKCPMGDACRFCHGRHEGTCKNQVKPGKSKRERLRRVIATTSERKAQYIYI